MSEFAAQFPVVETPPFEERFERHPHGVKVSCVMCGISGYHPGSEASENSYPKWWSRRHREHVMCTCGKVVSRAGIGAHVGSKRRHGKPCPGFVEEP